MKKALRKEIFQQRKALSREAHRTLCQAIQQRLWDDGFLENKRSVHLYYPINNEVDTIPLIESLWQKGVDVIMPRTDLKQHSLDHYRITSFDQLEPTTFNLLEPKQSLPCYTGDCDLILIPGLAFDHSLGRIGYGGGFYDRFLAQNQALKVAVAYDFQVRESIPLEAHDIRMDYIVTDQRTYS